MLNQNTILRFWTHVDQSNGPDACWPWTAYRDRGGYGRMGIGGQPSRLALSHRVAWEIAHGPIPAGLIVCHHCDNPSCCNPAHLFLGGQRDNMRDSAAKGRHAHFCPSRIHALTVTHCQRGHPFDEANTVWRGGHRHCRICHNTANRDRRAIKRAAERTIHPLPPRQAKTHCKHGHPFTTENTYVNAGQRHCRTCRREAWMRMYHARKG